MGWNEPIDYFDYQAVCIKLAALTTAVGELPNATEVHARAEALAELTHCGDWIRSGEKVEPKESYYARWREICAGM